MKRTIGTAHSCEFNRKNEPCINDQDVIVIDTVGM